MTAGTAESRTWRPLKWAVVASCVLALQVWFFVWFARPPGLPPRPAALGSVIHLPGGLAMDLPGSVSPLVLARPDAHGFSGQAWLQIPAITYTPEESNLPPFLLAFQTDRLGETLTQALSTNQSGYFEVAARSGPRFEDYSPTRPIPIPESTLAIEGELANRPLLAKPTLKAQPADTILTNTIVDVVVDAEGRVFAPPVLEPMGSPRPPESAAADAEALAAAAGLLFQPVGRMPGQPGPDYTSLTPGRLVFHWQTVPKTAAATNDLSETR